jgi:hypothetical protein
MMVNIFLNKYHPQNKKLLLKYFPPEEQKSLIEQNIESTDLSLVFDYPYTVLKKIHYSWIQPVIAKFPLQLQPMAIAALPEEQRERLKKGAKKAPCPFVKSYYINTFSKLLELDHHRPLEFLPQTELSTLMQWSKGQLVELIDFLGLYDLASTVRQIVDRNTLNNIYRSLSKKQLGFLKICLHQKERISSPKLNFDPSSTDQERIRSVIHRRGLTRFTKSLCGQHPDFVWMIAHLFDKGRGEVLLKEFRQQDETRVTEILKQQVMAVMNFLQVGDV